MSFPQIIWGINVCTGQNLKDRFTENLINGLPKHREVKTQLRKNKSLSQITTLGWYSKTHVTGGPMTCYFHHRLFLILCVCRSVRECLHLIDCGPKNQKKPFPLSHACDPSAAPRLMHVFMTCSQAGRTWGETERDVKVQGAWCFAVSYPDDQLGHTLSHTHTRADETMRGAWERSIELVCIILLQDDRRQLVGLSHYQKPGHQRHNHSILSPFINYNSSSRQTTLTGKRNSRLRSRGRFLSKNLRETVTITLP